MHILLTGATGYIGQQILPRLLKEGHRVMCCVRDPERFHYPEGYADQVEIFQADFLEYAPEGPLPEKVDVAYYLIHSMSGSVGNFEEKERITACNFLDLAEKCGTQQIIYLSGISNEDSLSRHLKSRRRVEDELRKGEIPVTVLRAGIIVGAGSASFEIIRDLVEKLPVMLAPKWLQTRSQPIAIENVLEFLVGVKCDSRFLGNTYDIGGPDVLTYKEMLLGYAAVRGMRRKIVSLPFLSPRLSAYWLYFMTSVSYPLAVNLVDSMKVEVIARENNLAELLGIELADYEEALMRALKIYRRDEVLSSWKDALSSSYSGVELKNFLQVPEYAVRTDCRKVKIDGSPEDVLANIWAIGGQRGWYYSTWLWKIRGFLDKLVGGIGLRRGRTHAHRLERGDALDFWRVLVADRNDRRLLLFAEMKLPGEAWLEFRISEENGDWFLHQKATFRPRGLMGRLYWYSVLPFHFFVFDGMAKGIVRFRPSPETQVAEATAD